MRNTKRSTLREAVSEMKHLLMGVALVIAIVVIIPAYATNHTSTTRLIAPKLESPVEIKLARYAFQLQLKWGFVLDAARYGYEIQYYQSARKIWENDKTGGPLAVRNATVTLNKNGYYRWRARGYKGSNQTGPWSEYSYFSLGQNDVKPAEVAAEPAPAPASAVEPEPVLVPTPTPPSPALETVPESTPAATPEPAAAALPAAEPAFVPVPTIKSAVIKLSSPVGEKLGTRSKVRISWYPVFLAEGTPTYYYDMENGALNGSWVGVRSNVSRSLVIADVDISDMGDGYYRYRVWASYGGAQSPKSEWGYFSIGKPHLTPAEANAASAGAEPAPMSEPAAAATPSTTETEPATTSTPEPALTSEIDPEEVNATIYGWTRGQDGKYTQIYGVLKVKIGDEVKFSRLEFGGATGWEWSYDTSILNCSGIETTEILCKVFGAGKTTVKSSVLLTQPRSTRTSTSVRVEASTVPGDILSPPTTRKTSIKTPMLPELNFDEDTDSEEAIILTLKSYNEWINKFAMIKLPKTRAGRSKVKAQAVEFAEKTAEICELEEDEVIRAKCEKLVQKFVRVISKAKSKKKINSVLFKARKAYLKFFGVRETDLAE